MEMFDMAFWSIVPALLTIALAIITKEVLLAMFIGVFTGCMFIENLNPLYALAKMVEIFLGVYNPEDGTLIPGAITEPGSAMVLIIIILIGGFIGLMVKSGASLAFAELLSSKVSSPKRARCTVWLIGMLLFFDDYFNDLTNGTIMRPISDRYEVPREKLAYIIDSTTVGICQISPISTWVAFICSLMGGGLVTAGIEGDAFKLFIQAIPYNYYAWVSLAMVISVAYFNINYGPMATAERRTAKSGLVCEKSFGGDAGDDDFAGIEIAKGKANDLIVPLLILIVGVLLFLLYTGGFFQHFDFLQTVNSMDGILAMTYAFLITVVFCVVYFAIKGLSSVMDSIAAIVIGAKSVLYAMMVLSFGWALGGICEEMNAVGFMISAFQGNIPQFMTPFIAFLFAGLMTFAIGGCWGTYAIMIPLVIPLAVATDASMIVCLTAVIGGGGLGCTCSPLADTSIVSSMSANVSLIDHIKTQAPYSLTCGAIASVGYLLAGILNSPLVPMVTVIVLFVITVFGLNKLFGEKKADIQKDREEKE